MPDNYVYVRDFRERARVPQNGILSQTLYDDGKTKVVLFGFAPGQELSAHTAPFPAILTFLKGEATLKLGADEQEAVEGTFVHMTPVFGAWHQSQDRCGNAFTMFKNPAPSSGA